MDRPTVPDDLYKVLGLAMGADKSDIRSAYRKLFLKLNSDRIDDPKLKEAKYGQFRKVQEAYETLYDDNKRMTHDLSVLQARLGVRSNVPRRSWRTLASAPPVHGRALSPFRQCSPYTSPARAGSGANSFSQQTIFNDQENTPKTISPKDAVLDYHVSEENIKMSLFPEVAEEVDLDFQRRTGSHPGSKDRTKPISKRSFESVSDSTDSNLSQANVHVEDTEHDARPPSGLDLLRVFRARNSDQFTRQSRPKYSKKPSTIEMHPHLSYTDSYADAAEWSSCPSASHSPSDYMLPFGSSGSATAMKKGLPIDFQLPSGTKRIMTQYDSGTLANHMSLEQAQELNLEIRTSDSDKERFRLANGKIIHSIGKVYSKVGFAQGDAMKLQDKYCCFNVFKTLALPVLMGMKFLSVTETLSKYKNRLVDIACDPRKAFRICSIGDTPAQIKCQVNDYDVIACADTGSEIALIRKSYALRRGFRYARSSETIMFADGSIAYTEGSTVVEVKTPTRKMQVTLHIYDGLSHDVLLDEITVQQLDVFRTGVKALYDGVTESLQGIAAIIHLSKMERAISAVKDKLSKAVGFTMSGNNQSIVIATSTASTATAVPTQTFNERYQQELRHKAWVASQGYADGSPEMLAAQARWRLFETECQQMLIGSGGAPAEQPRLNASNFGAGPNVPVGTRPPAGVPVTVTMSAPVAASTTAPNPGSMNVAIIAPGTAATSVAPTATLMPTATVSPTTPTAATTTAP